MLHDFAYLQQISSDHWPPLLYADLLRSVCVYMLLETTPQVPSSDRKGSAVPAVMSHPTQRRDRLTPKEIRKPSSRSISPLQCFELRRPVYHGHVTSRPRVSNIQLSACTMVKLTHSWIIPSVHRQFIVPITLTYYSTN